jgi:hypothetical protein
VATILSTPWIAATLGALMGIVLMAPLFLVRRLLTPANVEIAIALVVAMIIGGMVIAVGALFGYQAVAPDGQAYFGIALVAGFVVALGAASVIAFRELLAGDETRG